jgi:hypothetical protein
MDQDYTRHLMPRKPRPTQRGYGGPIVVLLVAIMLLLGLTVSAFAQSSESTAISGANSEVQVTTGAAAGSAINNYGQKAGKDARTYQEVATAPSLGGLALGGGHPCAYSPATAQVSLIGGGAGIGGMKVDSACMLMVMGATGDKAAYKAAQLVIAGRDPAACAAMQEVGLVTGCKEPRGGVLGGGKKDFSTKATAASSKSPAGWGAKCQLNGKKLVFQPTSKAARDAELSACKSRYGL